MGFLAGSPKANFDDKMDAQAATLFGVPLKYVSLLTLVVQNSMLVLVMKYSRRAEAETGGPYLASTAVMLSELSKLVICLVLHMRDPTNGRPSVDKLYADMFGPESDAWKMMVPAALYVVQNNLQYLAVTNLDPATFQVSYQMKILTTAVFSVIMLNRSLTRLKWLSLVMLTFGIALVQIPPTTSTSSTGANERSGMQQLIGLSAVAVACVLSGLAGVWFEKVLKGSKASLWLRNTQLSFFSLIPCLTGIIFLDGSKIAQDGLFQGYTRWTFGAIACQAIGGLIVALVVKYADNILKGFATSISIILSAVASVFLFDFQISLSFCVGASIVLYATHLYGLPDATKQEYTQVKQMEGRV
ncbi:UDP-N-acetylglucosamine transporter-like protein [Chytriomyces sp. MP71]|nr:UDP-N-acetylglucosamine transporter-like protein [Chytriomyces sp. MP71]